MTSLNALDASTAAPLMVLADDVVVESQDETHVVVVNIAHATRARLSRSAYRFLRAFREPRRVTDILPAGDAARVQPQVRTLVERRLLVEAGSRPLRPSDRLRTAVAYRFCNAPPSAPSQFPDFIVLGVPFDLASETDARLAPDLIRRKSLDYAYQLHFDDARPRGWFDADRDIRILEGASIADAGDIRMEYGEPMSRLNARIGATLRETCGTATVPLLIGGDRRTTALALGNMAQRGPVTAVQLTDDPVRAEVEGAGRRLLRYSHVTAVVDLGTRNTGPADFDATARLAECAYAGGGIYLSIDLGILHHPTSPGRQNPALHELKAMIGAIGRAGPIVAIDLVGLDMRRGDPTLDAIIACQLALAAMSAAHEGFRV